MEAPTEPNRRLTAFGDQLIEIHLWLREELAALHEHVDSYLDGSGGRPRELRAHCLGFCSALSRHHTGEDDGAFPLLAEQFPELRPVIEELERDHHLVAGILRRRASRTGRPGRSARVASRLRGEEARRGPQLGERPNQDHRGLAGDFRDHS
jgi:hypothetical protein